MASELRLCLVVVPESELGPSWSIGTKCGAVLVGWVLIEAGEVVRHVSVTTSCRFCLLGPLRCCWANWLQVALINSVVSFCCWTEREVAGRRVSVQEQLEWHVPHIW
jgi:hypothetical protein